MNTNYPSGIAQHFTLAEKTILDLVEKANGTSERAYWFMKDVDRRSAERFGVADKVADVLRLLQKVDHITMDIVITIKQKTK